MIGLLGNVLLRKIPDHLLEAVKIGTMKVSGSIIRDVATGRFAGHLQETSATAGYGDATLPGALVGAINIVEQAIRIHQNEQIKAGIATLHSLQIAGLALGAANIGVSVAGFALLNARINGLGRQVDALGDKLDRIARGIDALRRDRIAEDLTTLRTVAGEFDEGWTLPDPAPHWRRVAQDANRLADQFERRAIDVLGPDGNEPEAALPLIDAVALATATRVAARLAAGEDVTARGAAAAGAVQLAGLAERVSLGDLTLKRIGGWTVEPGTPEWGHALDAAADSLRPTITVMRGRAEAAGATAETLGELQRQQISGRAWLEAARDETEAPLLCLLPATA